MKNFAWLKCLIFKIINILTIPLFKNGVAGHMRVYIDEELITDSVESCIDSLDKLYISYHNRIGQINEIKKLKEKYGKKIVLIKQKYTNDYYKLYQKSFRRIWWKYYMKIDADQIYIKEILNENIKKIKSSKSLTILRMIGINIYSSNNTWATLKENIPYKSRILRIENGGYDHFIISRTIFQKYIKYEFDNRIIERFCNPFSTKFNEIWGGVNWLHFGNIKLGVKSLNKNKCNIRSLGINNLIQYKKSNKCDSWLANCINFIQINSLYEFEQKNSNLIDKIFKKSINAKVCKDHLLYNK